MSKIFEKLLQEDNFNILTIYIRYRTDVQLKYFFRFIFRFHRPKMVFFFVFAFVFGRKINCFFGPFYFSAENGKSVFGRTLLATERNQFRSSPGRCASRNYNGQVVYQTLMHYKINCYQSLTGN